MLIFWILHLFELRRFDHCFAFCKCSTCNYILLIIIFHALIRCLFFLLKSLVQVLLLSLLSQSLLLFYFFNNYNRRYITYGTSRSQFLIVAEERSRYKILTFLNHQFRDHPWTFLFSNAFGILPTRKSPNWESSPCVAHLSTLGKIIQII